MMLKCNLKEVYYLFICAPTKMAVFLQTLGKAIVVLLLQCPLSLGSILQGLVDLNRHPLAIRRPTASHCRGIDDVRQLDLAGKMWNGRSRSNFPWQRTRWCRTAALAGKEVRGNNSEWRTLLLVKMWDGTWPQLL